MDETGARTQATGDEAKAPPAAAFNLLEALRTVCLQAHDVLDWKVSLLLLNDEATGLSCLVSAAGLPDELTEILMGAGVGATEEIYEWLQEHRRVGQSYVLERLGAGSPFSLEELAGGYHEGANAEAQAVVVPIEVRGLLIGVLCVYDVDGDGPVPAGRLSMLQLIAGNVAALIDQANSAERANRRFESGQLLGRLASRIQKLTSTEEIFDITVRDLREHLAVDSCCIASPENGDLRIQHRADRDGLDMPLPELLRGLTHDLNDAHDEGHLILVHGPSEYARTMLLAPLVSREQIHEVLLVASIHEARRWQPYEQELVRALADQLGVAVAEARAQVAADLAELRYRDVVDSSTDSIFIVDLDGTFLLANPALAELLGREAGAFEGTSLYAAVTKETGARLMELIGRAVADGTVETVVRVEIGGRTRELEGRFSVVLDEAGNPTGVRAMLQDVTEKEAARRDLTSLLQASQALAQANDLNSALSGILEVAETAVACQSCAILLAEEGGTYLRVAAQRGYPSDVASVQLPVSGPSLASGVFRQRQHAYVPVLTGDLHHLSLRERSASALVAPLQLRDDIFGVLMLEADREYAFGERETKLAIGLAHEAAVAIHRTRLFDRVALGKREWEATFDAMVDSVFLLDRDGRVVRANRQAARVFEISPSHLKGAKCCRLFCGLIGSQCATQQVVTTGIPLTQEARGPTGPSVLTVSPIRNRTGVTTGAVAIVRELPVAAGGVRPADELDARVGSALAMSPQAIVVLDGNHSIYWANRAAERLLGTGMGLLMDFTTLFAERERTRLIAALDRALAGEPQVVEVQVGDAREVSLSISAHLGDTGQQTVLVLVRDSSAEHITAQQLSQQERSRTVAQLAHGISRTLTAAIARASLCGGADASTALEDLVEACAPLVRDLDHVGRTRPDRLYEPLELNRIIESAVEATRGRWQTEARSRKVDYKVEFEPCRSARALGSPAELRGVFVELIENALDAQPSGGEVEIKTIEKRGLVGVQIRDSGPGMSEEVRLRAFDPWFTTKQDHAGLGLARVFGTITRHGGRISMRSAPGEGTSYQIVLPAHDDQQRDGKVVVVGAADPALRLHLLDVLEQAGIDAIQAFEPSDAVWAMELRGVRALIVDAGAFKQHGERLVAVCKALPAEAQCLIMGDDLPEGTRHAVAAPNVRIVGPGILPKVVELLG